MFIVETTSEGGVILLLFVRQEGGLESDYITLTRCAASRGL